MRPGEQTELLHVIFLHQRQHEPDEADAVQAERQEAVVGDEEPQRLDPVEQHAEVVEEILAVEEVVWCKKEVPGEAAEPGQAVDSIDLIADRDDFLETFDLDRESLKHEFGSFG